MPTNTIKHRMLTDAKRIAEKEYHDMVEKARDLGDLTYKEYTIPAFVVRNDEIDYILKNHPEYNEDIFRGMIKTFMQENKENKSRFLDKNPNAI